MFFNMCSVYNSKEAATGIVSDVNLNTIAGFENLFVTNGITISLHTVIRSDADITIKLNKSTNDAITVKANTTFEIDWLEISAIFITAAGSANLKVMVGR